MDAHTLELLEFDKVRELLAGYAASTLGKARARTVAPISDASHRSRSLQLVSELAEAIDARFAPPVEGLRDIHLSVRRASLGVLLDVEQILEVRDVLELTGRIADYRARLGKDYPALAEMLGSVADLRRLVDEINAVIDGRGRVNDSASDELRQIRRELSRHNDRIQIELRRLLNSPEIREALRFPNATMSDEHHVLPVAVNHRHKVAGVVHRASGTGETVYIEPARVAQINADMVVLRNAEEREIRKVLRRLTTLIGKEASALSAALETLTELDSLCAKARYSIDFEMSEPRISEDGRLVLHQARHPLLMHLFRGQVEGGEPRQVVPIDVHLGAEFDVLVITGPNTGGKTVVLKTIGLIALLALSGLHIPARPGSQVPVLDDILADIGDEQSLEQSLSTFSAHMTRISAILAHCRRGTLVLLDELGSGTDPAEGAALGRAILDELGECGCLAMVTTHLGDLKTYALSRERAENAAVEFDAETLQPKYRLHIGQFGESCALKIARRLNVPRRVLHRAHKYFRRRRARGSRDLEQLQQMRQAAEEARARATEAMAEAERSAAEFRQKADLLQQEAAVTQELEKFRASLRAGDNVRVSRFSKSGRILRVDSARKKATIVVGAVQWELPLEELLPIPASG